MTQPTILVKKVSKHFEIVEKNDFEEKTIGKEDTYSIACKVAKKIRYGAGFAGFTPNFILTKIHK